MFDNSNLLERDMYNMYQLTLEELFIPFRYESNGFFDQTSLPGNVGLCGNRTTSQATAFDTAVQGLLTDLVVATPRINGYFAASTRAAVGADLTVYAVAQCAQTVSSSGCLDCLTVAHSNIQNCPPEADGRAVDAGCFLRYSDTSFFPANQTTNITPFLGGGNWHLSLSLSILLDHLLNFRGLL